MFPAIAALLIILLAGGLVFAAMQLSYTGSVEVVESSGTGGTGTGGTPPPVYTFAVYDAEAGGNLMSDSFWSFGTINVGYSYNRTVYIENTGNQPVSVMASVVWGSTVAGTFSGLDTPVVVPVGSTRVAVPIEFVAGASATGASVSFTMYFDSTP